MVLHLQAVKKKSKLKSMQIKMALLLLSVKSKLESRQIKVFLHLLPVKRVS